MHWNNVLHPGVKPNMNFNQMKESLAAPLAALFLVLILYLLAVHRPKPQVGLRVPMMKLKQHSPGYFCQDDRWLVVRLAADGTTWVNETVVQERQLRPLLFQIYENRHQRVAYLMADPSIPFGRVAAVLDSASSSIEGMHVVLLTEGLKGHLTEAFVGSTSSSERFVPPCDLEWKENGYDAPSMFENDLAPH